MPTENNAHDRIDAIVKQHHVVLFMKGDRQQPMCGFSAATSQVLNDLLPDYHTVDVLSDPDIRQGVKEYGNWPTIPQLYVAGELVGGADIVRQMYANGDLHTLFGLPQPDRTPPELTITDKAAAAIREAIGGESALALHLEVGADHDAGFRLGEAGDNDIITHANGLEVHLDPGSAQRAKGIVIDWVETMTGAGLALRFPGATAVKSMSVANLEQHLAAGDVTLIDVRPAAEQAQAPRLPQARELETGGEAAIDVLPKDTHLVFICHHGTRSRGVAEQFAARGFTDVSNVEGGMDAWARDIDSTVPRY